jgi:hypothetical protein
MKSEEHPMTINDALYALLAELEEGEVPDPLRQRFLLHNLWADLARLAGEDLPDEIDRAHAPALAERVEPVARRGSYAGHAPQFAGA